MPSPPAGVSRLACRGTCRPAPARRAHHDRLLLVESDTDSMLELFDVAVTWAELEYPIAAMVPPGRWLDFVERHRWHDPERVARIFGLATDIALRPARLPIAAELVSSAR